MSADINTMLESAKKIVGQGNCDGVDCGDCPSHRMNNGNGDYCEDNEFYSGKDAYDVAKKMRKKHLQAFRNFINEHDGGAVINTPNMIVDDVSNYIPVEQLTKERGENYGHPRDQFCCVEKMYTAWCERRLFGKKIDDDLERCLRHTVYMILTKLSRSAENPLHLDNFYDAQGYASLFPKCVEEE